jgi:surface protein
MCLANRTAKSTRAHTCTCIRYELTETIYRCGPSVVGSQTFGSASAFNANIGAWNTARVTTLSYVRAVSAVICVWRFGRRGQREPRRLEHRARQYVDICKCLFFRRMQRGAVMCSVGL